MNAVRAWFRRHFSDPRVMTLAIVLVLGFALILVLGDMRAPVLASLVIAYLREGGARLWKSAECDAALP